MKCHLSPSCIHSITPLLGPFPPPSARPVVRLHATAHISRQISGSGEPEVNLGMKFDAHLCGKESLQNDTSSPCTLTSRRPLSGNWVLEACSSLSASVLTWGRKENSSSSSTRFDLACTFGSEVSAMMIDKPHRSALFCYTILAQSRQGGSAIYYFHGRTRQPILTSLRLFSANFNANVAVIYIIY